MIRQGHHVCTAAVLLTLSAGVAHADPGTAKTRMVTRTQVDRACDNAKKFAETNSNGGLTFWDVTAGLIPAAGQGLWWRIDNIERWAVVDPLGAHGPNTQVTVWKTPAEVVLVSAFFTSDSGDWAYFVDYCYRPDGTLARTTSTFNSFVAANVPDGIRRERTRYFDAAGKVSGSRSLVSNLATGKLLQVQVVGYDEPAYDAVERLPFYPLLRSAWES